MGEPSRQMYRMIMLRWVPALVILGGAAIWARASWPATLPAALVIEGLLLIFPLMLASILVTGWRLAVLAGNGTPIRHGMAANAIGQLVVLLIPSRISEAAKPITLNLLTSLPLARGLAILAVERILDTLVLFGMAAMAVITLATPFRNELRSSLVLMGVVALCGTATIALIAARPHALRLLIARLPFAGARHYIAHIADQLALLADIRLVIKVLLLSVLAWTASFLIFCGFLDLLFPDRLGMAQFLAVFVASTLGLAISIAPGGLGTFEAGIALPLHAFGIPAGEAVSAALLLRMGLTIPVLSAASWYLATSQLHIRDIFRNILERRQR